MSLYRFDEAQEKMLRAIVTAYHDGLRRHPLGEVDRQAKLAVSAQLKAIIESGGMDQPRVVIDIECGAVSGVSADTDIAVLVVDGDTAGCDDDAMASVPHRASPVVFHDIAPLLHPELCALLFEQARHVPARDNAPPLAPYQ